MAHGQSSLSRTIHAIGRIGIHPAVAGGLQILEVEIAQLLAEIHILWLFAVLNVEHHRRALGLDGHLLCLCHLYRGRQQHCKNQTFLHTF